MDILQYMRTFKCVAETGSFTRAAIRLDTTTTSISRAISHLESHLRARLFNRTTRHTSLTDAGKRYLHRCEEILRSVEEAELEVVDAHTHPTGQLKVHSMTGIGQHYIIDAIARYRKNYPDVSFNLSMTNRIPNLVNEGFDVSIVLAIDLPDSSLISQKLGVTYSIVCASPSYVKTFGAPQKPADLLDHACLRLVSSVIPLEEWAFEGPDGCEEVTVKTSSFVVDSVDAMKAAISNDMGVGILPIHAAIKGLRNGSLVRVMPQYRLEELGLYAIYPSRHYLDAKIRTWIEYLRTSLPEILAGHKEVLKIQELVRAG
ncbi:LysR family transcriptional regulator [Pseudomonas gingeri]|uniref:LysR family transcriptional regulator n=1 Tax=Pseudomonas gingeri TaxID=117681 RepID=UPI0015A373C5|nr:LysR family transcriptional regulator [Pseudomonas gingeri]NVZ27821.1 LysR family transcriptional regulator [Pseudomonas gingeri]NWA05805.1 LysR family transcriptional regulator [Pseudomonas gingeri]